MRRQKLYSSCGSQYSGEPLSRQYCLINIQLLNQAYTLFCCRPMLPYFNKKYFFTLDKEECLLRRKLVNSLYWCDHCSVIIASMGKLVIRRSMQKWSSHLCHVSDICQLYTLLDSATEPLAIILYHYKCEKCLYTCYTVHMILTTLEVLYCMCRLMYVFILYMFVSVTRTRTYLPPEPKGGY